MLQRLVNEIFESHKFSNSKIFEYDETKKRSKLISNNERVVEKFLLLLPDKQTNQLISS